MGAGTPVLPRWSWDGADRLLTAKTRPRGGQWRSGFAAAGELLDGAPAQPESWLVGILEAPPPATIGVARGAGVVGAGQLQADASPLQHHEGAGWGAGADVGDRHRIHGAVLAAGQQEIAAAAIAHRRSGGRQARAGGAGSGGLSQGGGCCEAAEQQAEGEERLEGPAPLLGFPVQPPGERLGQPSAQLAGLGGGRLPRGAAWIPSAWGSGEGAGPAAAGPAAPEW